MSGLVQFPANTTQSQTNVSGNSVSTVTTTTTTITVNPEGEKSPTNLRMFDEEILFSSEEEKDNKVKLKEDEFKTPTRYFQQFLSISIPVRPRSGSGSITLQVKKEEKEIVLPKGAIQVSFTTIFEESSTVTITAKSEDNRILENIQKKLSEEHGPQLYESS